MRKNDTTYMVKDQGKEFIFEPVERKKSEEIYKRLLSITNKGNHAEVKRRKDGSLAIYEVKKNIIM